MRPWVATLGVVTLSVLGCASPKPTIAPEPSLTPSPSIAMTPTSSPLIRAPTAALTVEFGGTIHCAMFPYGCIATLSVVAPHTVIDEEWRPPASDPRWVPDYSTGTSTDHFDPTPAGALPIFGPGTYRLVVSQLGSSDVPSLLPDGSVAQDLLARCELDVEVEPMAAVVTIRVTFEPDGVGYGGSCRIERVSAS